MRYQLLDQGQQIAAMVVSAMGGAPRLLRVFAAQQHLEGLDTQLYPLGWTKLGKKLAILVAHPFEDSPVRLWELKVIDLATDRPFYSQGFLSHSEGGINDFWSTHGRTIQTILTLFQVRPSFYHPEPFPALAGVCRDECYETSIERDYSPVRVDGCQAIRNLQLNITKNGRETKTIYEQTWTEDCPIAAGVTGFLRNPLNDRLAVLLALTFPSQDGAPFIRRLEIVGARVGPKFMKREALAGCGSRLPFPDN